MPVLSTELFECLTCPLVREDACSLRSLVQKSMINKGDCNEVQMHQACGVYAEVLIEFGLMCPGRAVRLRDAIWHGRKHQNGEQTEAAPIQEKPGEEALICRILCHNSATDTKATHQAVFYANAAAARVLNASHHD